MESNTICGRGKDRVIVQEIDSEKWSRSESARDIFFVCASFCACLWVGTVFVWKVHGVGGLIAYFIWIAISSVAAQILSHVKITEKCLITELI